MKRRGCIHESLQPLYGSHAAVAVVIAAWVVSVPDMEALRAKASGTIIWKVAEPRMSGEGWRADRVGLCREQALNQRVGESVQVVHQLPSSFALLVFIFCIVGHVMLLLLPVPVVFGSRFHRFPEWQGDGA